MPHSLAARRAPLRNSKYSCLQSLLMALLVLVFILSSLRAQTLPATRESRFSRKPDLEITFQQGLLHYSRGQLAEAETEFAAVIKADPADAEAHYHLGLSQLDQNKAQAAVENLDQAVHLDATNLEFRAARATANIRLQRYAAVEEDLNALEPYPAWQTLVHYVRGQLYYAQGKLKEAADEFATAKRLGGTESMPAEFYEGLTYLRMRDLVRARSTFRESSLGADRDPTVAAASRQLDAVLATQQRRNKPWEFQLTLAAEYDSNVITLGSNVPNPAGISDKSDYRLLVQPRGSYSLWRTAELDAGIEASGYFTWLEDLQGFNIESYQAGPYLNYRINPSLYASIRFGFNYIRVGHDDFLSRNLVTPQLTYIEKDFGYTSGYYQFQTRDFSDDSDATTGDAALRRSGQSHAVGIVQGIALPPIFQDTGSANLELSYRFEKQLTDGIDFDGNSNTFGATIYTPLPFWKLRADAGMTVTYDRYDNENSLDTAGANKDRRRDLQFNFVTGLTRQISENCAVRVDYSYTNNDSNINQQSTEVLHPFDYDRHLVGVRLIFSY